MGYLNDASENGMNVLLRYCNADENIKEYCEHVLLLQNTSSSWICFIVCD